MKTLKTTTLLASSLALALAACGEEPVDDVDTAAMETAEPVETAEFDPLSRDYELTAEARERRDAFDMDAFQTEYGGFRDEMGNGAGSASGGNMANDDAMTGSDGDEAMANSGDDGKMSASQDTTMAGPGGGVMARGAMSWDYLDRNSDGMLSVAEYAIWAIPLDPTNPKPNDTAPYVSTEQANTAADSFFYYDMDGDTYLSPDEFARARQGADVA